MRKLLANVAIDTVITDMDGTLLVKKGDQIHPLNKEVLMEWQKKGKNFPCHGTTGFSNFTIYPRT